jgi:hypothetical protein
MIFSTGCDCPLTSACSPARGCRRSGSLNPCSGQGQLILVNVDAVNLRFKSKAGLIHWKGRSQIFYIEQTQQAEFWFGVLQRGRHRVVAKIWNSSTAPSIAASRNVIPRRVTDFATPGSLTELWAVDDHNIGKGAEGGINQVRGVDQYRPEQTNDSHQQA